MDACSQLIENTPPGARSAAGWQWPSREQLIYYRDLLAVLVAKEFKVRYKSTVIGYAWSLMHPLAFALVFFVLFKIVMRFDLPAYSLFLIGGLFPWHWISNTVTSANFAFLGNSSLIKKVRFHRATLVLASVLNELVHFAISIPIVVGFMIYYGRYPTVSWFWWLPALVVMQFAMTFGLALLIATVNLFFRDLERLSTIIMHLLFYVTPVIYPYEKLPPNFRWVLMADPFAPLVLCWQGLFYRGSVPGEFAALAALWALVCCLVGYRVYQALVWRFAEIV
ncbi:MAG: ABC transporter permease [Planctomycetaceae bacterium]|nr:ABC transporter permease [Planctomycetaceae bacterium]